MTKIDKNIPIPLYHQLAEYLREQINSKLFVPGDPLPSETDLINDFDLSRGTIRQALQILTQEGLIERHPGRGSFVSHPKIEQDADQVMGFFTRAMMKVALVASAKILEMKEFSAPKFIKSKLQLSDDESIIFVKRVRYANDEPIAIESEYFISDVGRKLFNEDLHGSIYEILQDKYDYVIHRSENTIEASIADSETASILNIDENNPIFMIHRVVFLADGTPFEYSEDIFRADRIRFSIEDLYQKEKTEFKINPITVEDMTQHRI